MAGDWIKMRTDLMDDPSVVAIAVRLEMEEDHVVGKLHRIWAWADRHTIDGQTSGITEVWVDRFVAKKGFAAAMQSVGWLVINSDSIQFPGFEKHNGESAKKRADAQQRQRASRLGRHSSVTTSSRDRVPNPFRRAVFTRDNYTCVYCGAESSEIIEAEGRKAKLSVDHVIPVSRGGMTVMENLATCCRACNYEKTDRTPEEWDLLPTFLSEGVSYENGHIIVTKRSDKTVTREEKRREEKDTAGAVSVAVATPRPKRGPFVPPTVDQVAAYVTEINAGIDPNRFVDHYTARDWVLNNGRKVVDWKACVRTWMGKNYGTPQGSIRPAAGNGQAGGLFTREHQREAANKAALVEFLQSEGVCESNLGFDQSQANVGLHGRPDQGVVLRLEAVPGAGDQSVGRGASNVGDAIPGVGGPVSEVPRKDAQGLLPDG